MNRERSVYHTNYGQKKSKSLSSSMGRDGVLFSKYGKHPEFSSSLSRGTYRLFWQPNTKTVRFLSNMQLSWCKIASTFMEVFMSQLNTRSANILSMRDSIHFKESHWNFLSVGLEESSLLMKWESVSLSSHWHVVFSSQNAFPYWSYAQVLSNMSGGIKL